MQVAIIFTSLIMLTCLAFVPGISTDSKGAEPAQWEDFLKGSEAAIEHDSSWTELNSISDLEYLRNSSGNYYLGNNIVVPSDYDQNGGVDLTLKIELVSGSISVGVYDSSNDLINVIAGSVISLNGDDRNIGSTAGTSFQLTNFSNSSYISLYIGGTIHTSNDTFSYYYEGNFTGSTIIETFNSNGNFSPISGFTGNFDGNGYTISGLKIQTFYVMTGTQASNPQYHSGLFGELNGTVKNLGIKDSDLVNIATTNNNNYTFFTINVGIIAGSSTKSLDNCYNEGKVRNYAMQWGEQSTITLNNGGIIGYLNSPSGGPALSVTYCYNSGHITTHSFITADRTLSSNSGGICGGISANLASFNNCHNYGKIDASGSSSPTNTSTTAVRVVGIVNQTNTVSGNPVKTIENCYNEGDLSGIAKGNKTLVSAAGITSPMNNSIIRNCNNSGSISAITITNSNTTAPEANVYLGGIITSCTNITLENCHNTGALFGESKLEDLMAGGTSLTINHYIGGVVGQRTTSSMTDIDNKGPITQKINIPTNANLNKLTINSAIGGVIGYLSSNLSVTGLANTGSINVDIDAGEKSTIYARIGGIVGYNYYTSTNEGAIQNCTNTGDVEITIKGETVTLYAGGICGQVQTVHFAINDCINEGDVVAELFISSNGTGYVGGVVGGTNSYTIADDLTDSSNSGRILLSSISTNKNAKATSYVGGIAGNYSSSSTTQEVSVTDCNNAGQVTGYLSNDLSQASIYVGGIIGYSNNGLMNILRCNNTAEIGSNIDTDDDSSGTMVSAAGGIVGHVSKGIYTISDSRNSGNVYSYAEAYPDSGFLNSIAGGIAGYSLGVNSLTMVQCNNDGSVTVHGYALMDDATVSAGGILGLGTLNGNYILSDCNNKGAVKLYGKAAANVYASAGGIAGGFMDTTNVSLSELNNSGPIYANISDYSGSTDTSLFIGGLVGELRSTTTDITGFSNNVTVVGEISVTGSEILAYAGGIIGYNKGSAISECYNVGKISIVSDSTSSALIPLIYVGGIAGMSEYPIERCYNMADVIGSSNESSASPSVGGITGNIKDSTVLNCYNRGKITASGLGSLAVAGGVVGSSVSSIVENCYNTGRVISNTTISGAIVGHSDGTVEHCYFLTGTANGNKIIGSGTEPTDDSGPRSDQQMQTKSTFDTYWDFDTIWGISPSYNDGYPILRALMYSYPQNYVTVTVTSTDGGSTTPTGSVQVIRGGSIVIKITPDDMYAIKTVTVNGMETDIRSNNTLSLSNIIDNMRVHVEFEYLGAYLNVVAMDGGTAYGSGYYLLGESVPIYAVADSGYRFIGWSNGMTTAHATAYMDSQYVTVVAEFEAEMLGDINVNVPGSTVIAIIAVILVLLAALFLWFFIIPYRRSYEIIKISSTSDIIGKDKARRKKPYSFTVNGPGAVSYRVGEEGRWITIYPNEEGEYVIPKEDVIDKITIEVR